MIEPVIRKGVMDLISSGSTGPKPKVNQIIKLTNPLLTSIFNREIQSSAFFNVDYAIASHCTTEGKTTSHTIKSRGFDFEELIIPEINTSPRPIVAGGSLVRYLLGKGEWQSDFDYYAFSEKELEKFRNQMKEFENLSSKGKHAKTYFFPIGARKVKIQSVNTPKASLLELFNDFDLRVCQFAYMGYDVIYTTQEALGDLINSRLVLNNVNNPQYTKARIIKYMQLGFTPTKETMEFLFDESTGFPSSAGEVVY